jgi:hypothetical protein
MLSNLLNVSQLGTICHGNQSSFCTAVRMEVSGKLTHGVVSTNGPSLDVLIDNKFSFNFRKGFIFRRFLNDVRDNCPLSKIRFSMVIKLVVHINNYKPPCFFV